MNAANEPSKALTSALRRVLRPLVRFMLAHGVTLPFLNQLLKQLYVEVAENDFALDDKPQTDSRVSLLTGVHRKDVRRLRDESHEEMATPSAISLGAQVVSNWLSEKRYLDKQGKPKGLSLKSNNANTQAKTKFKTKTSTPSFEELVASVSRQDLRPRVVLDELLRLEIVRQGDDERIYLREEAFIPTEGSDEQFHYFAQNIRDHISAASHNLEGTKPALLERAVTYHGLTTENVDELSELAASLSSEALKEVNRRAKQLKKRAEKRTDNNLRINFGTYFYSGDEDDER